MLADGSSTYKSAQEQRTTNHSSAHRLYSKQNAKNYQQAAADQRPYSFNSNTALQQQTSTQQCQTRTGCTRIAPVFSIVTRPDLPKDTSCLADVLRPDTRDTAPYLVRLLHQKGAAM